MKPADLDQWIGAIWSSDASPIAASPLIGLPTSIDRFWFSSTDPSSSIGALTGSTRPPSLTALPAERRLPDGGSHLVVRLDDAPLWLAETDASSGPASPMPAAALAGVRMRGTAAALRAPVLLGRRAAEARCNACAVRPAG